jgi:D-beta-D-heptose 7-phosphate kinase/D-beta-D-heptose 1-phosphate adenosyltransferase
MMAGVVSRLDGEITIVGDVMLDRYMFGSVDRISPEAPVPVLRQVKAAHVAGGAANVAMNAAALGGRVRLFGVVGLDAEANELRSILEGHGVNSSQLLALQGRPTTTKTRVVAGRQQIVRLDNESCIWLDADVEDRLIEAVQSALSASAVLVLSDYSKGVLTDRVITSLIDMARARGVYVVVDPKRKDFRVYGGANLIKPNRSELAAATGMATDTDSNIEQAIETLAPVFGGALLVTRAEAGLTLVRPGQPLLHLPVPEMHQVADVSGAGDTALAALAVALAEGRDLVDGARWALAASGLAVAKPGTAIIDRAELDEALATPRQHLHSGALVEWSEARAAIRSWRLRGERVVFANGCFDILHPGHIRLLEGAAQCGDRLIVALNTDQSVRALKGSTRPVQSERNRAFVIGALRFVDLVILFDEPTPYEAIRELEPDVIVKGADYKVDEVVGGDLVRARGGEVVLIDLVEGQSSSNLIAKMSGQSGAS